MAKISEYFSLRKSQSELDFVDVHLNRDTPLFIDPFALSLRRDRWGERAHNLLVTYFQSVVDRIREGNIDRARQLLSHLREPNETRLGLSKHRPQGAGIGNQQADDLLSALQHSQAVQTGFLSSLEECELMVPGIGRDKISDLTTNVLRQHLIEYTSDQCELHGIPRQNVAVAPQFDLNAHDWVSSYAELPVVNGMPLLLVPKSIVRFTPAYDHQTYYRHFALNYLQAEHLSAGSSLVHTFKNGRQTVFKKSLEAIFPCTKENLFLFSREHPDVLLQYRDYLLSLEKRAVSSVVDVDDEVAIAGALQEALRSIAPGGEAASTYHRLMIGIVEFLFFPHLLAPRKELEIHEGRKRIDILMENAASEGVFWRMHAIRSIPCAYVAFECKNYRRDIANPELDQISGRFSPNRGKVGIVCCRSFDDRNLFVRRCQDTFRDDRGLILTLDDQTVLSLLELIRCRQRDQLDGALSRLVDEVVLN